MTIILVILGAVIGAALFQEAGVVAGLIVGALVSFLTVTVTQLSERVRKLERGTVHGPASNPSPVVPAASHEPPTRNEPVVAQPARAPTAAPVAAVAIPASPVARKPAYMPPASPSSIDKLWIMVRDWFRGERAIPRVGIIILFFGVAFLLKYASEHSLLPIELRLGAAVIGAIALLAIGWRLRETRVLYGLTLQGGGIGVLYLSLFAAFRLYGLLPATFTFAVLAAVAVLSAALALLQNARVLAVIGAAGGFLAPVLVSTGGGSHVALFSYYALLNLGIFAIAWFRAWRELNVLGFVFTFVIGTLWGANGYRAELFGTTEPFLLFFFVAYVAISILFALRQPVSLRGYVDGTLVFGVPVVAFALQATLVYRYPYGLAWSAIGAGAFYIGLATLMWRWRAQTLRLLCEAFLALGVVFTTLAIPLALDGRWTSAAWALEGAAMVWIGVRQQRLLARWFGALLVFGAGVFFLDDLARTSIGLPVLNGAYLGTLCIALAALFAANRLQRTDGSRPAAESWLSGALFVWGLAWWVGGGLYEIDRQMLRDDLSLDVVILFAAFSALLSELTGARVSWERLRTVALALLPVGLLAMLVTLILKSHPLTLFGAPVWIVFMASHLWLLKRRDGQGSGGYLDFLYGATIWLIALLAAHEFSWIGAQIAQGRGWTVAGWGLGSGLAAAVAFSLPMPAPWREHREALRRLGAHPTLVAAGLWLALANLSSDGASAPLPYVPLFNPLDLVSLFVLACIAHGVMQARARMNRDTEILVMASAAALAFLWANAALLRSLHHWVEIPFDARAMMDSVLVQAALSIFWASLALVAMVAATRRRWRPVWTIGGGLLVLTVLKLFVIDLARSGTLARIVSFIVVGVLLLVIGYLAPIPPATGKEEKA